MYSVYCVVLHFVIKYLADKAITFQEDVPGSENYQFRVQCQEEDQVFLWETQTRIICNTTTGAYTSQHSLTPCTVA